MSFEEIKYELRLDFYLMSKFMEDGKGVFTAITVANFLHGPFSVMHCSNNFDKETITFISPNKNVATSSNSNIVPIDDNNNEDITSIHSDEGDDNGDPFDFCSDIDEDTSDGRSVESNG
eukprot:12296524-Ditylum_brightwellii.AAC.1